MGPIPTEATEKGWEMTSAANEALKETLEDMRENPDGYIEDDVVGAVSYGTILKGTYEGKEVGAIDLALRQPSFGLVQMW